MPSCPRQHLTGLKNLFDQSWFPRSTRRSPMPWWNASAAHRRGRVSTASRALGGGEIVATTLAEGRSWACPGTRHAVDLAGRLARRVQRAEGRRGLLDPHILMPAACRHPAKSVLPRLPTNAGHIHDVFLPFDHPAIWGWLQRAAEASCAAATGAYGLHSPAPGRGRPSITTRWCRLPHPPDAIAASLWLEKRDARPPARLAVRQRRAGTARASARGDPAPAERGRS